MKTEKTAVTEKIVGKILKGLSQEKSQGLDDIPQTILGVLSMSIVSR